jgi:hypothetical protein
MTNKFKIGDTIYEEDFGTGEVIGVSENGYSIAWYEWSIPNMICTEDKLQLETENI